jgi:hypothetical protein
VESMARSPQGKCAIPVVCCLIDHAIAARRQLPFESNIRTKEPRI